MPSGACSCKVVDGNEIAASWPRNSLITVLCKGPAASGRDVGALCATKSRTLPQIHFGSQCATERVYRYLPAKVGLKKSHFGKQSLTECALRHPPCQSELAELREPAICLDIFRSRPAPLSPYGKISLSLIPMRSRHKPDIESTVQREL